MMARFRRLCVWCAYEILYTAETVKTGVLAVIAIKATD